MQSTGIEVEKSFWIGKSHTVLEDNIIFITSVGDVTLEDAINHKERVLEIYQAMEGPFNIVIDINNSGKPCAKAREVWKELNYHPQTGKVALFGFNPIAFVIGSFVIKLSNYKSIRFFRSRVEAVRWIRG